MELLLRMKKSATSLLAVGLLGVVLVPATANAQQGYIPPLGTTANPCQYVTAEYRQSVVAARSAKKTAFRAAQVRFHAATSDERTQIQASGRSGARAYRLSTADERAERTQFRATAQSAFKDAVRAAKAQRRAGMNACR